MAQASPDEVQQAEQTQQVTTVNTEAALLMAKINESRRQGVSLNNPVVQRINNNTTRVEKGFVTDKFQFKDRKGKFVKKGKPYHIHYTKDLNVHYMTSAEHNVFSELIFPIDNKINIVGYYNTLNQQEPILLKGNIVPPTEADYNVGFMIRSFARKTNDERKVPFEIKSDDVQTSPLYDYLNLTWYLTGTAESVELANRRRIELAAESFSNIAGLLNPFQYFRKVVNLSPEESIRERLGESPTETTQTQTQTTSNQAQGAGAATGPPPGVMTGGAGGSGY